MCSISRYTEPIVWDVSMDYRGGAVRDAKSMEMTSLPVQANTINTIPVGAEMSVAAIR